MLLSLAGPGFNMRVPEALGFSPPTANQNGLWSLRMANTDATASFQVLLPANGLCGILVIVGVIWIPPSYVDAGAKPPAA
ncbi:hypothetical protein M441DRAFT_276985 [Trichoderma asperellum CBS 433.97]|uniref:Uncharacterized protein n=1 Tax=Trichoderma asperellum (strain ATCC 204424 / CBS 433.97 / NBRC 101777) TaxID=1042311 RepID=A0A2T3YUW3_TRIA4|nr:hypothetical protein M441DRAFT_276985 [Trichoderma asperellum CBS 433.97]PTB36348.1 hypothetical protein M441DRAFT_276985 [Trichoderma asperellum CBS 433.97]